MVVGGEGRQGVGYFAEKEGDRGGGLGARVGSFALAFGLQPPVVGKTHAVVGKRVGGGAEQIDSRLCVRFTHALLGQTHALLGQTVGGGGPKK